MSKRKGAGEQQDNVFVFKGDSVPTLLEGNTHIITAGNTNIINPPGSGGKDRTQPDRERYKERQKGKLKGKMGDILTGAPVITRPGKVKIPVEGGYEPHWRPGRDGQGGGGSGNGKPGQDPGDYIEVSWEEFVEMFFEAINLPFLLKKQMAESMVKTQKRRGTSSVGPKARLNKRETAKARLKRAGSLANAQPEQFVDDFASKCQSVYEAYVFWAASENGIHQVFPQPVYAVIEEQVEAFLAEVENAGEATPLNEQESWALRSHVIETAMQYLSEHAQEPIAPFTSNEGLRLKIEKYVFEKERAGQEIPSIDEVPFHKTDLRYNRVEEREEPDSKCAVWLILDRSGSMSGDPIVVAKAWFFINVLFLRTKYKHVALILISHDGQEYLWKNEEEFFKIGAGGGTVAVPAWDLTYRTAEFGATCKSTGNSAGPYPREQWNRYMFQATDGQLFDGEDVIRNWYTKIIGTAGFNYAGYLEVPNGWGGSSAGWDTAGTALLTLPADVKAHLGMAKAASLQDVPKAFVDILDKDRKK